MMYVHRAPGRKMRITGSSWLPALHTHTHKNGYSDIRFEKKKMVLHQAGGALHLEVADHPPEGDDLHPHEGAVEMLK